MERKNMIFYYLPFERVMADVRHDVKIIKDIN